ncbi:hypothetical protein Hanom_Chr08g00723251 [Helianthus anomalus]
MVILHRNIIMISAVNYNDRFSFILFKGTTSSNSPGGGRCTTFYLVLRHIM